MENETDGALNPYGLKRRIGPFETREDAERERGRLVAERRRGLHRSSVRYSVEEGAVRA